MNQQKELLTVPSEKTAILLFGQQDFNLKLIEEKFEVKIVARGREISIHGSKPAVKRAHSLLKELISIFEEGNSLTSREIEYAVEMIRDNGELNLKDLYNDILQVTYSGKKVKPKTLGQKIYVDAIREQDLVFSIGPAGTGKTYLAMVMAVRAFMDKEINRIILTRPAIEAGEKLGFLPGDLQEKVDPYLRPLYDALYDIFGNQRVHNLLEKEKIEVAPLAYMRGRTLDDSFVILDEAQNTTSEQMKMFLTRLGLESKAIITGDITQIDLPANKESGLTQAEEILKDIPGISFVYLTNRDVVRHPLVQRIIKAYDDYEERDPRE